MNSLDCLLQKVFSRGKISLIVTSYSQSNILLEVCGVGQGFYFWVLKLGLSDRFRWAVIAFKMFKMRCFLLPTNRYQNFARSQRINVKNSQYVVKMKLTPTVSSDVEASECCIKTSASRSRKDSSSLKANNHLETSKMIFFGVQQQKQYRHCIRKRNLEKPFTEKVCPYFSVAKSLSWSEFFSQLILKN